jgi:membrane-associated phospholipid phosphatase
VLQRTVRFRPVDALTLGFAVLLVFAGLARWEAVSDHRSILLVAFAGLLPVVVAILRARAERPGRALSIFFDFYVIASILVIFDNLGPLIRAVNPRDRDALFIAFDHWLCGVNPTVALEKLATPFLSDVLTVCYALYYVHPIILGGLIYADGLRANDLAEFHRYSFTMVFVFFVSYAGYFALPAIGPRYTVAHAGPLPRGAISRAIDSTLEKLEKNKRDCFPSGHTMVVTAVLIEAARRSRRTFLVFLPFAIGLVACTVYGRYHYVADVLAGFILVFLTVPLGNAIYRRFGAARIDGVT